MATIGSLIVRLVADVTNFERNMTNSATAFKRTEKQFATSARRMESIGQSLMLGITVPLTIIGGAAAKAVIDWEDSFAGVRKTVNATEAQYAELAQGLRDMATNDIPQTVTALAGIAETAGQLGIQRSAILGFTATMAQLGDTSNLAGEEGATALARFDNVMQSGQQSFDRMGATIVDLGNNLATTESEIMAMAMRIAGAGHVVGLTEAQVFGLSGALSSVGIEAEAGGTAMSKVMIDLASSVATGGKQLDMFARVAGMSSTAFRAAWQKDAAGAMIAFVEGLGKVSAAGGNVFGVLDTLGLSEVRVRDALLRASGAGDLFRRSLTIANTAWEQNSALTDEAAKRYKTLASQFKFARNQAMDMAISVGEGLAPYIQTALNIVRPFIDHLRSLAESFAKLDPWIRNIIVGFGLTLALIGPVIYGFGLLYKGIGTVLTISSLMTGFAGRAAFAFLAWRGGAASVAEALSHLFGSRLNMMLLGMMALAALAIFVALNWDKFAAVARRVWNGVSSVVLYAASLVVRGVGAMLSVLSLFIPALRPAAQSVYGYADALKGAAANAWGVAKAGAAAVAGAQKLADVAKPVQDTADASDQAAKAQDGLGKSMDKAAKSADANLQSFDEVHQIQEASADAADSLAGLPTMPDMPQVPALDMPAVGGSDMFGGITDTLEGIGQRLSSTWETVKNSLAASWAAIKAAAYATFPGLETTVNAVNVAVDWVRLNWPTIGPIVEKIAGVITVLFLPALIKTGVEATIAGAKAVAAWVAQGWSAVASVAQQVVQFAIAGAKWIWLGVQAAAGAAQAVWAWGVQGWEAVASVAKQLGQFVLLAAKWVWMGIQAVAEGAKIVAVWIAQKAEAIASVAVQIGQFAIAGAKWVWMGIQAAVEGAKIIAVWIAQKVQAIASVAVQVIQFGIVVAQWVWMGIMSLAAAAQVALAWLIAMGPIVIVVAAVIALAALIIYYWDDIKRWTIATWTAVVDWLRQVWDGIKATAIAVWNGIKDFFAQWWPVLLVVFTGPIGALVLLIIRNWDAIKAATTAVWNAITTWLTGIWTGLVTAVTTTWTTIASTLDTWWGNIKTATETVWNTITGWLGTKWNAIKDAANNIWTALKNAVGKIIDDTKTMLSTKWDAIHTAVTVIWNSVKGTADRIWTELKNVVGNVIDGAKTMVTTKWNDIHTAVSGIWNAISTSASTIWDGLVTNVKGSINSVIKSINKFLDSISNIKIKVPSVNIPLVGTVGGFTVGMPNIPRIPMLAAGGDIFGSGAAIVGEAGPEMLNLPRGARVAPLSAGGGGRDLADQIGQAVYTAVFDAVRAAAAGQRGDDSREIVLQIDGQRFARAVLPAITREGQRIGSPVLRIQEG